MRGSRAASGGWDGRVASFVCEVCGRRWWELAGRSGGEVGRAQPVDRNVVHCKKAVTTPKSTNDWEPYKEGRRAHASVAPERRPSLWVHNGDRTVRTGPI